MDQGISGSVVNKKLDLEVADRYWEKRPRTQDKRIDFNEARTRKMDADARQSEMLANEMASKLVRTDSVVEAWEMSFAKVKTKLQSLPTRLGPQLAIVNLPITATFSDYLDNSTVTSTYFFLKDNSSNLITSSVTYLDNKSATLTPSSNLSKNATYTATLKTGIKDLAGHALVSDYSWSFITGDFTAPILAEVTTVTSLNSNNTPNYTFSSTEAGTITYGGSYSSSTTTATSGNNSIVLSTLSDGTHDNCTITVTNTAENAGNTVTLTSFTIETVVPTITSTAPSNGDTKVVSGILATFSELLDNSTITNSTFTFSDSFNNSVSGNITISSPCELDGVKSSYPDCCSMSMNNIGFILKYNSSGTKQ